MSFTDFLLLDSFFFFNATATTEIYTLSLHDALPIFDEIVASNPDKVAQAKKNEKLVGWFVGQVMSFSFFRSEEHTSELQSRSDLVCRLLLEKKKENTKLNFQKVLSISIKRFS